MDQIRNFCIIAHIDHGKSTLADRLLEITGTIEKRLMQEQLLDTMDLERERGITIKLQPVTMFWQANGTNFIFNLIDTPGHVDFAYEVSRSLAAVEGAILLIDATQGIQAQTLSTLHQAREQNLTIIPVINKIDLPHARPEEVAKETVSLLGCTDNDIIFASGKTGEGVEEIIKAIVNKIPSPNIGGNQKLQALIFDSKYDPFRGVIAYVRVMNGMVSDKQNVMMIATKTTTQIEEVGIFRPHLKPTVVINPGQIGYLITGIKDISLVRVGDTITDASQPTNALVGYRKVIPMVFASLFPSSGQIAQLRDALAKLKLNDASLSFEPENSTAFGFGFRCGFLGLLHLEIIKERLEREYNIDPIITTPSVAYKEHDDHGKKVYSEPWARVEIVTPASYIGAIMKLAASKRGKFIDTKYFGGDNEKAWENRAMLEFELPLAELIVNFYDQLKSISSGYASMNYELLDWRAEDLVKLDILIAEEVIDSLGQIVHRAQAQTRGQQIVLKLKQLIPKQQFVVKLQAAIGGKIIAREDIPALAKDVIAKLYGGDRTRKDKLLKKQKAGKKRLQRLGKVEIPGDVFIKLLK